MRGRAAVGEKKLISEQEDNTYLLILGSKGVNPLSHQFLRLHIYLWFGCRLTFTLEFFWDQLVIHYVNLDRVVT